MKKKEAYVHRMVGRMVAFSMCVVCLLGVAVWAVDDEQIQDTTSAQKLVDDALLSQVGTYTVAYSEGYSPFSYTDTNGTVSGMAIAVMDYVAQTADIDVVYVSVDDAKTHGIPVDINLAILEEDQIEDASVKSIAYTSLQMMIMSEEEAPDLQGATVGHLPYHYLENTAIAEALPGAMPNTYFSYNEMSQAFSQGTLDYMLISSLLASQMLETEFDRETYIIPSGVNLDFYMSFSNTMSQEEVVAFNQILRSLDGDYVYNLMLSSVIAASKEEMTVLEIVQAYAVPILLFITLALAGVAVLISKTAREKRKFLEQTLNVDEITGLMTEHKFIEEVATVMKTAQPGEYFILTIDIDNFKTINEIYGYDVGTQAIVLFGKMLETIFAGNNRIARVFADEFVVLHREMGENFHIHDTIEFERYISRAMADLLGESYRLTTSTGIYPVDDVTVPVSYMIDCASVARVRGKANYGISKEYYTKKMDSWLQQKNEIVRTMEGALQNEEFHVYYQPKTSLQTGQLLGAEALVRWIMPDGKMRYPDSFIPLFESNGFIVKLDFFVLESVCIFLQENPQIPAVSVNFSGHSILKEWMVKRVWTILKRYEIEPSRIHIEITESAVVRNFEAIAQQSQRLKEVGFSVSMDDFGAGVSSLNRLKDLQIDELKIDKMFLSEDHLSLRGVTILEHIIAMSNKLGLITVAEGVETQEQVTLLRDLGCDIAQGYYYAKPMPQADYLSFVEQYQKEV